MFFMTLYLFIFFGAWCLDLSVGCLELSVGCLELSFGCLDFSFGCLEVSFGCLDLSFGCLELSFGCLDLSFGCMTPELQHLQLSYGRCGRTIHPRKWQTRVIGACRRQTRATFVFIWAWKAAIGLKLTGREGCVGLWWESIDFADTQKVETLILSGPGSKLTHFHQNPP